MSRKNITISVIISAYNNEKELKKCFNSLLEQTYSDFEVIFRDNNSSDNTYSVALSYREQFRKRGIYLFTDLNKRTLHRYQCDRLCIKECEGELFFLLSPQCSLKRYALQKIADFFYKNDTIGALIIDKYIEKSNINESFRYINEGKDMARWLLRGGEIEHSHFVVDRQAMIPISSLKTDFTYGECTETVFLISCFFDIGWMKEDIFLDLNNQIQEDMEVFFERYLLNCQMKKLAKQMKIVDEQNIDIDFQCGMKHLALRAVSRAEEEMHKGRIGILQQFLALAKVFDSSIEDTSEYKEVNNQVK